MNSDKANDEAKVVALLTCHNRRDLTVKCLKLVEAASSGLSVSIVLVDDGSSDGTAEAARQQWPGIRVVGGDGELFWAGGMALAERTALEEFPDATHLLWLNDDVELDHDALTRLLDLSADEPRAVIAGALHAPHSNEITYSGLERPDRHPMRYRRVSPSAAALPVETFNGNLVLVPRPAALQLGGIDSAFGHQLADLDYGHRAHDAGLPVLLAAGTFGSCSRNAAPIAGSLRQRWSEFNGPKGSPLAPRVRFLRRHGGHSWPLYVAPPYLRLLVGRNIHGTQPASAAAENING